MLFNSIEFLYFLPCVLLIYFMCPPKYRWILLLVSSYIFYMSWKLEYIFLIIISTLVDFYLGKKMGSIHVKKKRKPYLILSLLVNLGLLFSFKYFNFFAQSTNDFFQIINFDHQLSFSKLLLPVGISFYTFQTLSYSIDVYKGRQKPETHLGHFALYVSFFPQLVAGPIERFSALSPQLKAFHHFSFENLKNGLRLILYGLFIKMVIADNLSTYIDLVYEDSSQYSSISILKAIFFYSFQIYSDFYGYSIIAIGTALIMGIKLMDNFKTPYLSQNIGEFWQRWHISLSTWFKDYLYFPLGGNRTSKLRWLLNISIVFLVSGIWHGANWTFIFWGGLYAIVYIIENLIKFNKNKNRTLLFKTIMALKTFSLVSLIWVFFRSQTIEEAFNLFYNLINNTTQTSLPLEIGTTIWILLFTFIIIDGLSYNNRFDKWISSKNIGIRWMIYSFFIFSILVFSGVEEFQFIYFQF